MPAVREWYCLSGPRCRKFIQNLKFLVHETVPNKKNMQGYYGELRIQLIISVAQIKPGCTPYFCQNPEQLNMRHLKIYQPLTLGKNTYFKVVYGLNFNAMDKAGVFYMLFLRYDN